MDKDLFIKEVSKLGIELTNKQLEQLNNYYKILVDYNQKVNLTAITKEEDFYLKHFYDSLTIVKVVDLNMVENICDVGTGAGFPGMVLKIVFPNLSVTLVDSLNKRVVFLKEVIKSLNLNDIVAIHSRVEDFAKVNREKYDVVTARAVTSLPILLEYCMPLVKKNKYFIPLKGSIDEIDNCGNALKILNTKLVNKYEFELPIENSKRIIYKFEKIDITNKKYPRNTNEIKRRAL